MPLYLDDSAVIEQTVTDEDGDPVNTATVTVTIYDCETGLATTDEAWPVTLDYVAASDGVYRKTFDPFTSLTVDKLYKVVTPIDGGGTAETSCTKIERAEIKYC